MHDPALLLRKLERRYAPLGGKALLLAEPARPVVALADAPLGFLPGAPACSGSLTVVAAGSFGGRHMGAFHRLSLG
jgi:hypothetical protein